MEEKPAMGRAKLKCLRCSHEYSAPFDPQAGPQERTCPRCRSNSIRRMKETKVEKEPGTPGGGKK